MKYVVAFIAFAFSFIGVAVLVGFAILSILKLEGVTFLGIGPEPHNIPGTILGLLVGIVAWRTVIRKFDGAPS